MARGNRFRTIRIGILLLVLVVVALSTWQTQRRSTDWDRPLWVVVYPVNGDDRRTTADYIRDLNVDRFQTIEIFLAREAQRLGLALGQPVTVRLAPPVAGIPPSPPPNTNIPAVMFWSLKMRYWAHRNDTFEGPAPDIRIFTVYHDPGQYDRLDHSFGLEKGLVGVVNAFADRRLEGQNNVVIVHELLHTLGATDKYDLRTNLPIHPAGYAEPDRQPRYPQTRAEIMGGRIPRSTNSADIPENLDQTVIGRATAVEINWLD